MRHRTIRPERKGALARAARPPWRPRATPGAGFDAAPRAAVHAASPAIGTAATQSGASLARCIGAGSRAALFAHVPDTDLGAGVGRLATLVAIAIALHFGWYYLFTAGPGTIEWRALPGLLFELPVLLLAGWLVARAAGEPRHVLVVPVLAYAMTPFFYALQSALGYALAAGWLGSTPAAQEAAVLAFAAFPLWWWAAIVAGSARLAGLRLVQVPAPAAVTALLAGVALLAPPQPLWQPAPREPHGASIVDEQALHAQFGALERALAGLEPQRPGVEDLYYLGVAAYAEESVFLREAAVIERLMNERFDTRGRSLTLVNHVATMYDRPIATATNLARALDYLGRVMDPDEDVLVLYFTSHGERNHDLAVSFEPLRLQPVTPRMLAAMLDAAGIRYRVLAISACYSGGYIEPLADSRTLVMTAADATRTSFGCGPDSDFTYWGRAVFDEQLRLTFSFAEAFRRALPLLRERERAAGHEFSNPQIAVGEDIAAKLARIEARLARQWRKLQTAARWPARSSTSSHGSTTRSTSY